MQTEASKMTKALCEVFHAVKAGKMSLKEGVALAMIADATVRIAIAESVYKGNGTQVEFFDKQISKKDLPLVIENEPAKARIRK